MRTYRVTVRGVFDGLDDERRALLRQQAGEHDLFAAEFSAAGTLTYDHHISAFSHRMLCQVDGGPGEEDDARTAGELSAIEHLDALGVGFRRLRSTVTCMDDVKIRRPRRP